ncbi:TPA: hypothetical protein ACOFCF_003075 [Stenotrophomonas maltophilia]
MRRTTLGGPSLRSSTSARRLPPSQGQRAGSTSALAMRLSSGLSSRLPGVAPSHR